MKVSRTRVPLSLVLLVALLGTLTGPWAVVNRPPWLPRRGGTRAGTRRGTRVRCGEFPGFGVQDLAGGPVPPRRTVRPFRRTRLGTALPRPGYHGARARRTLPSAERPFPQGDAAPFHGPRQAGLRQVARQAGRLLLPHHRGSAVFRLATRTGGDPLQGLFAPVRGPLGPVGHARRGTA
jgi:hypothetical protein